jgi:hypothetical protein
MRCTFNYYMHFWIGLHQYCYRLDVCWQLFIQAFLTACVRCEIAVSHSAISKRTLCRTQWRVCVRNFADVSVTTQSVTASSDYVCIGVNYVDWQPRSGIQIVMCGPGSFGTGRWRNASSDLHWKFAPAAMAAELKHSSMLGNYESIEVSQLD